MRAKFSAARAHSWCGGGLLSAPRFCSGAASPVGAWVGDEPSPSVLGDCVLPAVSVTVVSWPLASDVVMICSPPGEAGDEGEAETTSDSDEVGWSYRELAS